MEISVIDINKKTKEVLVETEVGNVWGKWCVDTLPQYKKYDIEIDSDDKLNEEDIEIVDIAQMLIFCEQEKIFLYGFIEDIQENVLSIRVLCDIIMIEVCLHVDLNQFLKKYVRVKVNHLNFYDTEII